MSETVLYKITKDYEIEVIGEFRNSRLAGPVIWNKQARHIGEDHFAFYLNEDKQQRFWASWRLKEVPMFEKIVLLSTYDNCYVKAENLSKLTNAFKEYVKAFPELNTHLQGYIDAINDNLDSFGVCWHLTSITDCPWHDWDEDEEESKPHDFSKEGGHWELFEYLEEGLKDS
jgi:hypothetical protein